MLIEERVTGTTFCWELITVWVRLKSFVLWIILPNFALVIGRERNPEIEAPHGDTYAQYVANP